MCTESPLVIIGSGLAGYSLAKEWRKLEPDRELIIITQEEGHFYSKPQLSIACEQCKTPEQLIITPATQMASQLKATLFAHAQVTAINSTDQIIHFIKDKLPQQLRYGKLVFAVGATPKAFPLLEDFAHHYRINNLQDYHQFRMACPQWQKIAIIGSGLVGTEFAHDFSHLKIEVHVVTPDTHPLSNFIPESMGKALQTALSQKGIKWHTQTHVCGVELKEKGAILQLTNGGSLEVDAILTAIGLSPNTKLAKMAQVSTGEGIIVDKYLQTNIPNIFALGDCAEIEGVCRQYVAPILQCARALAQTLCDHPTAIKLLTSPVNLKVSSYPIITVPPLQPNGTWDIHAQEQHVKALYLTEEGLLQGYALSGEHFAARQEYFKAIGKVPPAI